MNKKALSYFFLLLALFVGAAIYSPTLQSPLITALNSLKSSYFKSISYIGSTIDEHFFQAQTIKELTTIRKNYKTLYLKAQQCNNELHDLYMENNSSFALNPDIELVRAISYQKFGDFTRLWMDIPDYNSSKIYGLLYNEYVAGIVINKHNKPLALLNSDLKSTYAVYIGEKNAPGIAHGNSDQNLIVSFIPAWFNLRIGDEVKTSGLDNIFFKNLKVGKVIAIKKSQGYQDAVVAPYFKSNELNYFHIIRKIK